MSLSPYNDFHYLNDFEVSFRIDGKYQIADLQEKLKSNNFQFESGYFDNDKNNGYYLIPRRDGIFTPFHIISEENTSRNRYLSSIEKIEMQISEARASLSEEFVDLMDIRAFLDVKIWPGKENRIINLTSKMKRSQKDKCDLVFDNVEMSFRMNDWIFTQK